MYVSLKRPSEAGDVAGGAGRARWIGANVVALGLTSLLTDVSSEMTAAVLPLYLTVQLGFSPAQFGLVDGANQLFTALLRPAGAYFADRRRRYKQTAAAGYGLSALSKLGLAAVAVTWPVLLALVFVDRLGKGLRTSPRDAIITLSTPAERFASALGVHRAMDTAGALGGPLLAFVLLSATHQRFDVVFVWSLLFAVGGLTVLLLFVTEPTVPTNQRTAGEARAATAATAATAARRRIGASLAADARVLWRQRGYRRLSVAAALLAAATVSDAFLYLALEARAGIAARQLPLLFVGAALAYLALAVPVGRLADRFGRRRVLVAGYLCLLLAYAAALAAAGPVLVLACLGLLGAYYAATDGVLVALASTLTPPRLRASGIALVTTGVAAARLVSSVTFGAVWSRVGVDVALVGFGLALCAALAAALRLLRPT
ncbi:MAG: MFS transporter [Acidimicrobiales bacterium]